MDRFSPDRAALQNWLTQARLWPNECWYQSYFDKRRRTFLTLSNRHYTSIDEPNIKITRVHERLFERLERGDPTLRWLEPMPDRSRAQLIVEFIVRQPIIETRDALLQHWASRPGVLSAWQPGVFGALFSDLGTPDAPALDNAFREHLELAARPDVERWMQLFDVDSKPCFIGRI